MSIVNRREFLISTALPFVAFPSISSLAQQSSTPGQPAVPPPTFRPMNRFPRMVQEWFVEQVRQSKGRGQQRRKSLQNKADAEQYIQSVRERIQQCFGKFPEKTPLNPIITGIEDRNSYRIEKVIFESRPKFFVTANLYVPQGRPFPLPAVVGECGHSANGKAAPAYQSFAQGLARQGYVVLIFDPLGQGERSQYAHLEKPERPDIGVNEHLMAGNQQFLVGEFLGSWRAWDGVRALDYLLTRPEVDPKHLGITGNSGGGTMTTWLCGVERRWTMAAPACFVTSFLRNLQNELPADTEQCPPNSLALDLDHCDFLAAMAPRPIVILAQERDFFDVRGAEEAYAELKQLYRLLDAEDNIRLHVGPQPHGYSIENRTAMYQWFNRFTGISNATTEPELTIENDATLQCTKTGNVGELQSKTVFEFTRDSVPTIQTSGPTLVDRLKTRLKIPPSIAVPEYRILRTLKSRGYPFRHMTTYAVETQPGIQAIVYRLSEDPHISRPPKSPSRAVLYVPHLSSDAELRNEPLLREIIADEPNADIWTCDVRGAGESQPDTCGENMFQHAYGSDYFYAIHSLMLGWPYVGQKTFDLLTVLAWMKSCGRQEVHLVGKGRGAIPVAYAALLSEVVKQVTLKNTLQSYAALATTERYTWPLSVMVPNALNSNGFDLPWCYQELQTKKLRSVDPWSAIQS